MSRIQKGKEPEVKLNDPEDHSESGFKVTLQKPSKIKSYLDLHVVGQSKAKNPFLLRYITTINESYISLIPQRLSLIRATYF